jgi:hypothetical protein
MLDLSLTGFDPLRKSVRQICYDAQLPHNDGSCDRLRLSAKRVGMTGGSALLVLGAYSQQIGAKSQEIASVDHHIE